MAAQLAARFPLVSAMALRQTLSTGGAASESREPRVEHCGPPDYDFTGQRHSHGVSMTATREWTWITQVARHVGHNHQDGSRWIGMRNSRIRAKLGRDEPALITTLHLMDESLFELTSLMGFDGIWVDLEHHVPSVETMSRMMRAARVGSSDIVARPAKGELMRMGRLLEAGAQAVMYPQCDSADEAAEVARWARFPPKGRRGFDGSNPDVPYLTRSLPEYTRDANEQTLVIIQIETPDALEQVEAIARTDGVDILMVGPADLSLRLGIPGQFDHSTMDEAIARVAAAARASGKHWGKPVASTDEADRLAKQGARFFCHQADIIMVKDGLESIQRQFSPLGFTFDNRLPH